MGRRKWGARKMPYETGRLADPLSRKSSKQAWGCLGASCYACVALFALFFKGMLWVSLWLGKWIALMALWCWKQIATAAVYVTLGVKEWWEHRNE